LAREMSDRLGAAGDLPTAALDSSPNGAQTVMALNRRPWNVPCARPDRRPLHYPPRRRAHVFGRRPLV